MRLNLVWIDDQAITQMNAKADGGLARGRHQRLSEREDADSHVPLIAPINLGSLITEIPPGPDSTLRIDEEVKSHIPPSAINMVGLEGSKIGLDAARVVEFMTRPMVKCQPVVNLAQMPRPSLRVRRRVQTQIRAGGVRLGRPPQAALADLRGRIS